MKKFFTLFGTAFCLVSFAQTAQQQKVAKINEQIFFEKTGLTKDDLRAIKDHPSQAKAIIARAHARTNDADRHAQNPNTAWSNEVVVSGSADLESEIHAAMNPMDSSKVLCSPNMTNSSGLFNPIYYSGDFGAIWNQGTFDDSPGMPNTITGGGGDPMFAYDNAGKVYYSWIRVFFSTSTFKAYVAMYWAYSTDNGQTWLRAANDHVGIDSAAFPSLPDHFFDKEWMAVDHSSSIYQNDLYMGLYQTSSSAGSQQIVVYKKPSAANAFNPVPAYVTDNSFQMVQFTDICVDNNGNVHVAFFGTQDGVNYAMWHSVSTDGGLTFSTPNKISDIHTPGYCSDQPVAHIVGIDSSRYYPCTHIAVDNSTGSTANNLYATWTANGLTALQTQGLDIYFSRSTDGGATWSAPMIINNDVDPAADNFYSAITVNSDGVVFMTWYDRRTDPVNNKTTNYYMAYSTDGGQTFMGNQSVTNAPTDFSTIGSQNQGFGIGEYTQVVAAHAYAIPVWTDARANDGNTNIYCATIPWATFNGIHDPTLVNGGHLAGVFPIPAQNSVNVQLSFTDHAEISLDIFDMQGKKVQSLYAGKVGAGKTTFQENISTLAAGDYFLVLRSDGWKEVKKISVVK